MATDGVALGESDLDLVGTVFGGRFRIEERIAEGGFAVVYKAWQVALDRRVALKVLKAPRNHGEAERAEFREKFAAEAKTIARLRHPHIVDVYDFSLSMLPSGDLAPWMALEWLDGETLAMHLRRRRGAGERGMDPREAVDFLRPVMQALAHAHGQGIVHRDIKPSNIMVTQTLHGPSLRVLDFGIAKIMVDDQSPNTGDTRTESAPVFSPAYAAPEQVAFSRTGPWTDVHALGLILSEVMTDEPPFSDPDPDVHVFEQVMARRRPTPASKGRDVGPYEPIIAKALMLSPRDRWKGAGALLAALEDVQAGGTAFLATGVETADAAIKDGVDTGRTAPTRTVWARLLGPFGALALVTAMVLVGAGWIFSARKKAPEPRPSPESATAPGGAPMAQIREPVPGFAAAPVLSFSPPLPVAVAPATPAPSLPAGRRKDKKRPRLAPAPVNVGDGRDLFDDTN